ncbi:EAL domain-containing protein [Terriglobus albidus]|uniref:EAL domain-containing protein n=1 Tax=Terriglobus albidus TaxID=1592106 RepID=UPI0021DF75B2|nr:EAL domain-containing protein [Terriglobus albidus]
MAMYLLGRSRSVETEQRHLTDYGNWTVMRANITLSDAVAALKDVEAQRWHDCSQAHIEAMRLYTMNHRAINEVGFFKDGYLVCTSWGVVDHPLPRRPPDYRIDGGIGVHLRVTPLVTRGQPMIGFEYGSHNVLVDPVRMVDVLVDNEMALALANSNGEVLATLNNPDPAVVRQAIDHPGPGEAGNLLYSSYRTSLWTAVAIERRTYTRADFHRQELVLLPVGLLIAGLMVGTITWALRRRLSPLSELEIAVKNKEFIPWYQPIVELATGRCIGAEALARWHRPDGTIVGANIFIPVAEQSELIRLITDLIVERTIADMYPFLSRKAGLHIAINLSADDVETGRPLPLLAELLRERGIPPNRIWLEVTERGFINATAARDTLMRAQAQGHIIAVDDFGTGYSNLGLLHSLPLNVLKIDKSFVDAIGTESATSTVIAHIIDMANELQLEIIAEGIETAAQAEYLRSRGVRYGQGWFFAKAMQREEFLAYYRLHKDKEVKSEPALSSNETTW